MSDQAFEFDLDVELKRRRAANPANPANPDCEISEISKISSFSKGVPLESEGSATGNSTHSQNGACAHQRVEHWDVRRVEIPSQTTPGQTDVWMVAERTDGVQQIRLWFAGTEPTQNTERMSDNVL